MIKEYLLNPRKYWPESHFRNADKIEKFLSSGCGSKCKVDLDEYVESLLCLGRLRKRFIKKHLYIVNAGSSGSHWIEAMLNLLPGFNDGGEIYLPGKVIDYLATLSPEQADIAIDVLYLAHSGGVYKNSLYASLSNSAHLAKHEKISRFSQSKVVVLLLRNPVDIVISRTFRKDEYKQDVAPGLDDKEYLEKNCVYVENFYKELDFESFDLIVKYEDFLDSPSKKLNEIAGLLGLDIDSSDLENAVLMTSKSEEKKSVAKGSVPLTNVYLGEKKDCGWAKEYIKKRLSDVIEKHGFF